MSVPESTVMLREQLQQARAEITQLRRRLAMMPKPQVRTVLQQRTVGYYVLPVLEMRMTASFGVYDVIVGGHD